MPCGVPVPGPPLFCIVPFSSKMEAVRSWPRPKVWSGLRLVDRSNGVRVPSDGFSKARGRSEPENVEDVDGVPLVSTKRYADAPVSGLGEGVVVRKCLWKASHGCRLSDRDSFPRPSYIVCSLSSEESEEGSNPQRVRTPPAHNASARNGFANLTSQGLSDML